MAPSASAGKKTVMHPRVSGFETDHLEPVSFDQNGVWSVDCWVRAD